MATSIFEHLTVAPPDPILGTAIAFRADTDPKKVNVGIGAYRTDDGKPYVLKIVRKVEQELALDNQENKEYAPVDGKPELKACTQKLLFGDSAEVVTSGRIASAQGLSGTGCLRIAGEFMKTYLPSSHTIWLPNPTWGNHIAIFEKAGLTIKKFPYWDAANRSFDFDGMMRTLESAQSGDVVLLHACAHNPTGIDPTPEQWQKIVLLLKNKKLVPLLDNAYQGFASGDLDRDGYSGRLLVEAGLEFFLCQSFAKNMGLYGERFGMLHIITANKSRAEAVLSQLKLVIRPSYSSPPIHGGQLVQRILTRPEYLAEWKRELKEMADRILDMRAQLQSGLERKGTPGSWKHITQQIGMFSFTGLSVPQSELMIKKHHIYMLKNGRISMAGINRGNVEYVVNAIDDVVRNVQSKL